MKILEKGEAKILLPFYIERFISHLFFFAPAFWVLQFQQYFSLFQIGILFGITAVVSFIFEIPTGAFADVYGRKASTLLGYFLTGISVILIYFTHNFYHLIILFALWGLSSTFISGARESWVIDRIKAHKKEHLLKDFYIKEQSIMRLSLFLSGLLGAFLVSKLGLDIIWLFAGISFIVTGLLLTFIKEFNFIKNKPKGNSIKSIFKQAKISVRYSWKHYVLFFLLVSAFFILFRDNFGGDLVWQPFLKSLGFPIFAFGILFSVLTLIGTFTSLLAKPLVRKFKSERDYLIFLISCWIILDVLVLTVGNYLYGLILLLLMITTADLFMPISSAYFQKHTPSKMRATITSFQGMIMSLAVVISMPLSGFVAENIGPKYTIVLGSLFLIPALILYLRIKDKNK